MGGGWGPTLVPCLLGPSAAGKRPVRGGGAGPVGENAHFYLDAFYHRIMALAATVLDLPAFEGPCLFTGPEACRGASKPHRIEPSLGSELGAFSVCPLAYVVIIAKILLICITIIISLILVGNYSDFLCSFCSHL